MRKQAIIDQAKAEGIPLSRTQLDRYIKEGLLLGHRQSAGYKKGVYSTFPAAMDTIRLIHEYTQNDKTKRSADLIFTLFWNGYTVNENKLKEAMVDYQHTLRWSFNKISRQQEDPDQLEHMLKRLLHDDQKLIPSKPGRPSKQDRAEKAKILEHHRTEYLLFMTFVRDGVLKQSVEWEALQEFFKVHTPTVELDLKTMHANLQNISTTFKWIDYSTEIDFLLLKETISMLREYEILFYLIADLIVSDPSGEMNRMYQEGWLSMDPEFIRFFLIMLLASGQLQQLNQMLQNEALKELSIHLAPALMILEGVFNNEQNSAADQ